MTLSLLPSFPFLEKPRPRGTSVTSCSSTAEETDSPQSPLPDEEGEVDIQPHRQKMLVQFPFQKRKAAGPRGLLARNPQDGLASLLTRRTTVLSLYPTTGQIPMVLVPPLGGRYLPLTGNGVGRADHPMRHLRRNQQTEMRLHPNRSRACLPKQQSRSHRNKE